MKKINSSIILNALIYFELRKKTKEINFEKNISLIKY